jgi:3-oxoacyl-[acyl-carrier protein] reductase
MEADVMATQILDGKVALITGAGGIYGFGRIMTLAMVREGAQVVMMDVNSDELQQSANDARTIGGKDCVLPLTGDIGKPEDAEHAVKAATEHFGSLHILVNNAGIGGRGIAGYPGGRDSNFWDIPSEVWDRVVAVNMSGAFYMARAAIGTMLDQGWGRLIGVTTSLDTMLRAHGAPYGPSKAGHEAFMSTAAYELTGTGVTANILVPGGSAATNLGGNAAIRPSEEQARLIQPEVMGPPAVWLASEDSNGFNGRRLNAVQWDENLPISERVEKASSPIGWRELASVEAAQRAASGIISHTRGA